MRKLGLNPKNTELQNIKKSDSQKVPPELAKYQARN